MSKESQYPRRKSMSSSHAIEKTRALRKNQERINTIQCMKLKSVPCQSGALSFQ